MFFKTPGRGTMIPVRMKPDMLAAVDAWIAAFYEASRGSPDWDPRGGHRMTRQEAVRWIIVEHLMLDEA